MQPFLRLFIWPSLAGLAIALLFLNFFPEYLPQPASRQIQPNTAPLISTVSSEGEQSSTIHLNNGTSSIGSQGGPFSYSYAVKKAAPAVANIYTTKIIKEKPHPLLADPLLRDLFNKGGQPRKKRMQASLGSGVIISGEGYVLTNNHVIANADEIIVALRDGRESFAQVVGTDPETDIAVLKIDLPNLPSITLASSDDIEIGDVVLAIGNPFGVGQTVTMGIISATGRNQLGLTTFEDFIQTDAAINPGNSGGALINPHGDLIGINTAIFSGSGGSQGIGFAIPTMLAQNILEQILTHGRVIRGWLGVEVQEFTVAEPFFQARKNGVLITAVSQDGPAYLAGLKAGDILLTVDSIDVQSSLQVMNQITMTAPGDSISLEVLRNNDELVQLKSLIGTRVAQ
jgi:serine protease DegS